MKFNEFWAKYKENAEKQKILNEFENQFYQIMTEAGVFTKSYLTFKLYQTSITDYGFNTQIYNPLGLKFSQLEDAVELLEDGIGCTFVIKRKKRKNYLFAKVIVNDVVSDTEYDATALYQEEYKVVKDEDKECVLKDENKKDKLTTIDGVLYEVTKRKKLKPYEFFIGYDASGKPVIINMVHYAHLMITGSTRSGKSKLLDCILTSLIYHCSPEELSLYLFQIAKNDLILYEDFKQVRGYAETLNQAVELLIHIVDEMDKRAELIKPMHKAGLGNNILEYNKRYPQHKLPFVHVVFDEMSSLIDIEGEDDETKKLKKKIIKLVSAITQYGGALGVNGVFSLQRATHDKLPPFAKSNCNLVISFKQNNQKSSEVAIGDPQLALGLEQREIVYRTTDYDYAKVPLINDRQIVKILEKMADPKHPKFKYSEVPKDNKDKKDKKKKNKKEKDNDDENDNIMFKAMEMMMAKNNETLATIIKEQAITSNFPRVSPTFTKVQEEIKSEKELQENISRINGFVPYTPPSPNTKVIDKTFYDPSKTGKPIKNKKE